MSIATYRRSFLPIMNKFPLPLTPTDPRDAVPQARRVVHRDVDGHCDKLVTDDRHQFITLTVHLS